MLRVRNSQLCLLYDLLGLAGRWLSAKHIQEGTMYKKFSIKNKIKSGIKNPKRMGRLIPAGIKKKWFYSYLIVFFIPIIVSCFIFAGNVIFIERQEKAASETILKWGADSISAWQNSCYTILNNVINNNEIYRIINNYDNSYDKKIIRDYLESYKNYSSSVSKVALFVPEQDWVATSETFCDISTYYQTYANDGYRGDRESWEIVFGNYYKGEFIVLPIANDGEVVYVTSISYGNGEKYFNLIVSLNSLFVNHTVEPLLQSPDADFLLVHNGMTAYSLFSKSQVGDSVVFSDTDDMRAEVDKRAVVCFVNDEVFSNMQICYVIPTHDYFLTLSRQIIIALVVMMCSVALGIFLITLLIKSNYNPISSILSELPKNKKTISDEYKYIYDSIKDIVTTNTNVEKQLRSQSSMIKNNILVKLIKQGTTSVVPEGKMLEDYGIYFVGDKYAAVMFYLEDISGLFAEEKISSEEQLSLARLIIENIIAELSQKIGVGNMVDIDNTLVFLMNFEDDKDDDTIRRELYELCVETKQFIYDHFDLRFTMAISAVHMKYDGIKRCLTDCLAAMEYRLIKGVDEIIEYSDAESSANEYHYSIQDEQRLINSITAGNVKEAQKTAEAVIVKNIDECAGVKGIKLLVFDMMGTLYKAIDGMRVSDQREELRLRVDSIMECRTIEEIRDIIRDIIDVLCDNVSDIKDSMQNIIVRHVMEYVNTHYWDISLSVAQLAENHKITPNYLSKIFKDVTGERLLYYIHNVRLAKAKEMLLNEKALTIEQIANKVGYSNTATFNRTFLKFEGMPPTEWLKRNSQKNSD